MPAKTKKIVPYVPQTKIPTTASSIYSLLIDEGLKISDIIDAVKVTNTIRSATFYSRCVRQWDSGEVNISNYNIVWNDSFIARMARYAFPNTEVFKRLNEQFLTEYDSRADLQELYAIAITNRWWVYTVDGESRDIGAYPQFKTRPETFIMWSTVMRHSTDAKAKVELSRQTPYREGDLVVLRKLGIGRRDYDPMYVSRYGAAAMAGQVTPDESVERIGTVISITEKIESYRAAKGTKIIKVLWMGVESGDICDVPEKYLKWRERPTYANGGKVRE